MTAGIAAERAPVAQPSSRRVAILRRLAAILATIAIVEAIGLVVVSLTGASRFQVGGNLPSIGFLGSVVLFPTMGALIVQRRPATRVAWLMIAIGVSFGFALFGFAIGTIGPSDAPPATAAAMLISQPLFVPVPGVEIAWLLLLFPTDRLVDRRWRWVGVLAVVGGTIYAVATILRPGPVNADAFPTFINPFALPDAYMPAVEVTSNVGNTLLVASIGLAAISLAGRYRTADRIESAQIRWIALVGVLVAVGFALAALQQGPISDVAFGLSLCFLALMPIAIGFAISRYRLYDIDRLINRALVYGSLTAILAGVFTAGIGFAQRLFVATTGQSSDAAIVLTTLVVATLYAPLRKRLEAVIDRWFKYEDRRFGAYRTELETLLSLVEPNRAWARLAEEAMRELAATGSAVVDSTGSVLASAGSLPESPIRLAVPGRNAAVVVGPRADGQPHDPRAVARLEELAALVSAAVRTDVANPRFAGGSRPGC